MRCWPIWEASLIVNKRIVTTLAKAKALRTYVEPLITKTKKGQAGTDHAPAQGCVQLSER